MPKRATDDKKKKKVERVIIPPEVQEEITEHHKKFYILQITELEEKLEKYGKALEEYESKDESQQMDLNFMLAEQRRVVQQHSSDLAEKTNQLNLIRADIETINNKIQDENGLFESLIESLKLEYSKTQDEMQTKLTELEERLEMIKKYETESSDLHKKVTERENDLLLLEAQHIDEKCLLEKKRTIDIDELKKEMITKIQTIGTLFRKQTDLQLSTTVKKTFQENASLASKLDCMQTKTQQIAEENVELKVKRQEQDELYHRLQLEEHAICKKLVCNKQILNLLYVKRNEEKDLSLSLSEMEDKLNLITEQRKDLEKQLHDLHNDLHSILYTNAKISEYDEYLLADIGAKQAMKHRLETLLINVANVLEDAIQPKSSAVCDDDLALISIKRNLLMEEMLRIINCAKDTHEITPRTLNTMQMQPSSEQSLPQYKDGNLGFVMAERSADNPTKSKAVVRSAIGRRDPKKTYAKKIRGPRDVAIESVTSRQYHKIADQLVSQVPLKGLTLYNTNYEDEEDWKGAVKKDPKLYISTGNY